MKENWQYLKDFWKREAHWGFLSVFMALMVVFFTVNYSFDVKRLSFRYEDSWWRYFRIFSFFIVPLGLSYLVYAFLTPLKNLMHSSRLDALKSPKTWLLLLFIAATYTFSVGYIDPIIKWQKTFDPGVQRYVYLCGAFALRSVFMIALPVLWFLYEGKHGESYYGFTWCNKHNKFYVILLVLVLSGTFLASLTDDFVKYYPVYKPKGEGAILGVSGGGLFALWEGIYAFNFVATEFFFRGFMVLALARVVGPGGIWIMASMYMCIHFSKPPGEAISSFFGGVLLGVHSLRSKSISGGVLLHIAIGVSMDCFALLWRGGI